MGWRATRCRASTTVAVPSPISTRPEPRQMMDRGRRQLAVELPPHDLGTRELAPDLLLDDAVGRRPQIGIGRLVLGRLERLQVGGRVGCGVERGEDGQAGGAVGQKALASLFDHEGLRQPHGATDVNRLPARRQHPSRARRTQERQRQLRGRVRRRGRQLGFDRAAEGDVGEQRQGSSGDHPVRRRQPARGGHFGVGRSRPEPGRPGAREVGQRRRRPQPRRQPSRRSRPGSAISRRSGYEPRTGSRQILGTSWPPMAADAIRRSSLLDRRSVHTLFEEIAPRHAERPPSATDDQARGRMSAGPSIQTRTRSPACQAGKPRRRERIVRPEGRRSSTSWSWP